MYATKEQLKTIKVPKFDCQRGLERYIVDQHYGDKTNYSGKTSYLYFNNPIYRVGKEGDPGSNPLLTSRSLQKDLKPNESALHTVHPTIDSGSVFLSERPWSQDWGYDREDMPNVIENDADVLKNESSIIDYNSHVQARDEANILWDRRSRDLPVYDNSKIWNDEEPDNVHNHLDHDPTISPAPYIPGSPNSYIHPSKDSEMVENFTNIRDSRRGYYGLEVPDSKGRMGYHPRDFNFRPKGDERLLNLSTMLGNVGSLMTPIANRAVSGTFNSTNFNTVEGFQNVKLNKPDISCFWYCLAIALSVAILYFLLRNKL